MLIFFFKSIAMTIKQLPRQAINEAKIKTLTLVRSVGKQLLGYTY